MWTVLVPYVLLCYISSKVHCHCRMQIALSSCCTFGNYSFWPRWNLRLLSAYYSSFHTVYYIFDYVTFLIPANYQKFIPQCFMDLLLFCIGMIVWVMLACIFWLCERNCRELVAVVLLRKHSILLSIRRAVIGIMSSSGELAVSEIIHFPVPSFLFFSKWILNFSAGWLFVDFVIIYFILFFSNSCSLKEKV